MFRSLLAAASVAVVALVPVAQAGPALASSGWSVVPAPPSGQGGFVTGISAPTATDAWAVGDAGRGAFADHWNGTSWSQVAIPAFSCTVTTKCWVRLSSVSATAADAWVLGTYSPRGYGFVGHFALYWNGSGWTTSTSPGTALADLGPGSAYALNGPFLETWNGTSWATTYDLPNPPGPAEGDLTTISATSASDIWIAGTYDPAYSSQSYDTYSLHWNGSAWTEIPMPVPSSSDPLFDYQINAIDAISPTNVWAVGDSGDNVATYNSSAGGGTPSGTLIEHYNGTSWSIVSSPATGTVPSLSGVAAVSASDVWAAGTAGGQTLTEQWNGSAWTTVTSPDPGPSDDLSSISATSGSGIVWAAGASSNGTLASSNPLILQLTT
jgi:hypothetical protein